MIFIIIKHDNVVIIKGEEEGGGARARAFFIYYLTITVELQHLLSDLTKGASYQGV